jgi:3,4-dihydroxy-2-butanone 4-phosphate synthase
MLRNLESQLEFYLVKCSDIECMVMANCSEEAANLGLKNIIKNKGKSANLSFIISVDLIKNSEVETNIFMTSKVLADLGYFKLAKELESLSDFFLDKGKNPH